MAIFILNYCQVELKKKLKRRAKRAEASHDRLRAAQLDAAVKADRCREIEMTREDRAKIHRRGMSSRVFPSARLMNGNQLRGFLLVLLLQ